MGSQVRDLCGVVPNQCKATLNRCGTVGCDRRITRHCPPSADCDATSGGGTLGLLACLALLAAWMPGDQTPGAGSSSGAASRPACSPRHEPCGPDFHVLRIPCLGIPSLAIKNPRLPGARTGGSKLILRLGGKRCSGGARAAGSAINVCRVTLVDFWGNFWTSVFALILDLCL